MGLPPDSIVALTLSRMQQNLELRGGSGDVSQERSGLLYMGNVHDAFPRRLFLDTRLSPLDKTAWVMIRLHAQQNDGAVFPTYDELQQQLAAAHSDKASRETISRTLLMLRLTGWLSLCKRVRDEHGRVRGNIYAQHDEPLGLRDAETFDPGWLELVASCCAHKNKSIRMTAIGVLNDILRDPGMRHRHSRLALVEERLAAPSTPSQMAAQRIQQRQSVSPGSKTELSEKSIKNSHILQSSKIEPGTLPEDKSQSSESELSLKSGTYSGVRKSNCNVRNITHSVNKKTYVPDTRLPENFLESLSPDDRRMLVTQFSSLPDAVADRLAGMLREQLAQNRLANPTGWMFAMLRRARSGELVLPEPGRGTAGTGNSVAAGAPAEPVSRTADPVPPLPVKRASPDRIREVIAAIRARQH